MKPKKGNSVQPPLQTPSNICPILCVRWGHVKRGYCKKGVSDLIEATSEGKGSHDGHHNLQSRQEETFQLLALETSSVMGHELVVQT
jgi:hypothetical protein